MKFDTFIASIDRNSPLTVTEQVAALLALVPESVYLNFNNARAAMPKDVEEAYSAFIRSKYSPAAERMRKGRQPVPAGERRIQLNVTLPLSLVERIPYPRSSFVERAILVALEK